MAGKFQWGKFADINLADSFFDSLKADYPGFSDWYARKAQSGESALVFHYDYGVGAFLYLKDENEPIELIDEVLPALPRVKIGTLRLSELVREQRLGEGAIGISLWRWQDRQAQEIYVTVFEKHTKLIGLFEKFGFKWVGNNPRGERVYLKSRSKIDYSTPYTAFPFIRPDFTEAGIIPIYEEFHDRLFPFSELMGNHRDIEELTAGNGITKIFIATPNSQLHYKRGDPVVIYRIYNRQAQERGHKFYKSVVTGYCTISDVAIIKRAYSSKVSLDDYIKKAGNKTVYTSTELATIYNDHRNVVMLSLVYNGFFGKGHNVIYRDLHDKGLFPEHPYNIVYSKEDFTKILEMGNVNAHDVIID